MFLNYASHAGVIAQTFFSNLTSCQQKGWQKKQISNNDLDFRSIDMSYDGRYQTFTAVSGSSPARTYPFISNDYGNTWKQITGNTSVLPFWDDQTNQTVKISKDGKTQVVVGPRSGNSTGPYLLNISYDYGNTWSIITGSSNLNGKGFDASEDLKVMGVRGLNQSGELSISYDSGVTWFEPTNAEALDPENFAWGDLSMSHDGQYMLVTENTSNGDVFGSSDSGVSWVLTNLFISGPWSTVKVSKNGDTQLAGHNSNSDLYISYDYGSNWQIAIDRSVTDSWQKIDISNNNKYLLATTNTGSIYRSKNTGVNWEEINLVQPNGSQAALGAVAISLNGKYQSVILKPDSVSGNSIYTNCNFGLDPGQIAEIECFEGLSNYSIEALYLHNHNPNDSSPESTSLCNSVSNVSGDNSVEIITPYSPSNFISQDAADFTATVILPSVRESQIDVNVQTVVKPGGTPLIDISYDGINFGQSTVVPISGGEISNTFTVRITGTLIEDNLLVPGTNDPGEIFLQASVPTDLSYDTSLTLLTIYPGGSGDGEAAPCGGPGHVCNRAEFDIIIGTGLDPITSGVVGVTVLKANLNNAGGPTDPGPGPFPYDGQFDRYSAGMITPEMSEKIFGPSHNDGTQKFYFVEIRPSLGNSNPHNGVTNVRIRDCSGVLVYNCCLGIGGGTNFNTGDSGGGGGSSLSFIPMLDKLPDYLVEI